jgi:hypothetical protein
MPKVRINAVIEGEINQQELASIVMREAMDRLPDFDDAGLDWCTDHHGCTYVGGPEWRVSSDPRVAALVDASHILDGNEDLYKFSDQDLVNPVGVVVGAGDHPLISINRLKEILDQVFTTRFLAAKTMRTSWAANHAGRKVLHINIGRRDVGIDAAGEVVFTGTNFRKDGDAEEVQPEKGGEEGHG